MTVDEQISQAKVVQLESDIQLFKRGIRRKELFFDAFHEGVDWDAVEDEVLDCVSEEVTDGIKHKIRVLRTRLFEIEQKVVEQMLIVLE